MTTGGRAHAEAFCLMTYEADDESERETVWNSRDGVAPFVISLRSGKTARHVDWHNDRYAPDHVPQLGERIFVDLTPERAREHARRNAERYWAEDVAGARSGYASADAMAEELAQHYLSHVGQPDLIEVTG